MALVVPGVRHLHTGVYILQFQLGIYLELYDYDLFIKILDNRDMKNRGSVKGRKVLFGFSSGY